MPWRAFICRFLVSHIPFVSFIGEEKRARLELYVQHHDEALHDVVEWDLNNPHSTPEQYASAVCRDLRLGFEWFQAIALYLDALIGDYRHALGSAPASVELMPPVSQARRTRTDADRPSLPKLGRCEVCQLVCSWAVIREAAALL